MKPWPESIRFDAPLREVRLLDPAAAAADRAGRWQQELQASYERGRIEGERALSQQLLEQRSELMELHNGVVASLQQVLPQLIRDSERALVQLSLEVARKLVGELALTPQVIETAIQDALAQVEETTDMTVLLHPEDFALLQRAQSPFLQAREGAGHVRVQEAPDITRGGCLVRTRFGLIDARRETKFELLQKALAS